MSEDNITKLLDAASIDARFQPSKARTTVCLNADIVLEIERLEEQLDRERNLDERENRTPVAPQIAEQIVELRERAIADEVEFVFHALGRRQLTDLVRAHPPTEEQLEAVKPNTLQWNGETFPPALLAASVEIPTGTTVGWWLDRYEKWPTGVLDRLFQTSIIAQNGVVEVPKAETAYGVISVSGKRSG